MLFIIRLIFVYSYIVYDTKKLMITEADLDI